MTFRFFGQMNKRKINSPSGHTGTDPKIFMVSTRECPTQLIESFRTMGTGFGLENCHMGQNIRKNPKISS